jgi:rhamnulokinase
MRDGPTKTYLAFDFGAESGRAVLARLHAGTISTEEIHRFPNEPVYYGGSLHWDVARLWWEVRRALTKVHDTRLDGIGVDCWGVDYALLGDRGELLQNPYHYRDSRTNGVMEEVFRIVSKEEIYRLTGIQFLPINTLYQLFAANRDTPGILRAAQRLLTIPDLFHYWLTGIAACEYTNASTTQMLNAVTRNWARDLLDCLEIPSALLVDIVEPGSMIRTLLPELAQGNSLSGTPVIAPASHDTGSAVAAITAREGTAFLSSGTWSLIGIELDAPVITPESLQMNFTNEGGAGGTVRFLKNVMGLWMAQQCRHSWASKGHEFEYRELMELAESESPFSCLIDPDDDSFLRPDDMPVAIDQFCAKTHQAVPSGPGMYIRTILESLALKYRLVLKNIEQLTGQQIRQLRVIGGGSKNRLMNQLTADATGKTVLAGPAEATALGNAGVQMLATGGANSLREVRAIIGRSFSTEVFEPSGTGVWDQQAERFQHYCEYIYARA